MVGSLEMAAVDTELSIRHLKVQHVDRTCVRACSKYPRGLCKSQGSSTRNEENSKERLSVELIMI